MMHFSLFNWINTYGYFLCQICNRAYWLSVILVFCGPLYGQAPNPNQFKPFTEVIPPSPDAAGLGKYGNTPVGLHTGIPQVDIPLYTIKSRILEVPISLSYHASGIKVNEMASWVGLGWSLNAGGVITRSVVGLPDDNGGYLTTQVKSANQITIQDIDYVRGVANGQIDGESDYYFYNFTGHAGKFVFDHHKKPFLIPVSPIRIKHDPQGWFEVTDEFGTNFKFSSFEYLSTGAAGAVRSPFKSSYYLSEMVSADGSDKIQFHYSADGVFFDHQDNYAETVGLKCNPDGQTTPAQSKSDGRTIREVSPIRLSEIVFSNGKVEFVKDHSRSDGLTSRLQELKVYSKELDDTYKLRKSFVLGEGYFISGSGIGLESYRLKLTEVAERDAQGKVIKRHSFQYNESAMLPPRSSLDQDWWGYYNGKNYNASLIPRETVHFAGRPFTVGNGNREPNELAMQACMLTKITYPTGGYTAFDFEPHFFSGMGKQNRSIEASAGELGNKTDLLEQAVLFTPATAGWVKVMTSCSDVKDANPFFSRVTLRIQNEHTYLINHIYDPYLFNPFRERLDKEFLVYLSAGVTYELKARSKGHSSSPSLSGAAFARAALFLEELVPDVKTMAGGLRIKAIRDYESPGAAPLTRTYQYGLNESGKGLLLIPPDGIASSRQEIESEFWWQDPSNPTSNGCYLICRSSKLLISGRAVHELSALNGSPVVYPEVAVYEQGASANNGKRISKFKVQEDGFMGVTKAYNNGRFQFNTSWQGGDEIWTGFFGRDNNRLIKETTTNVDILNRKEAMGTKIGWKTDIYEGNCYPPFPDLNHFYIFDYPIYSGIKKLAYQKETEMGSSDNPNAFSSAKEFKYDNLGEQHQQLSREIFIDSKGDTVETKYWYPADYSGIETIPSLLNKNIIANPVKMEQYRNRKIVEGTINRFNEDGKPIQKYVYESNASEGLLLHREDKIISKGYVKKVEISYDEKTKNVNTVQLSDNFPSVYLWGYHNTYPIAKAVNANIAEVAATSFESQEKGNWNYEGPALNDIKPRSGAYYYKLANGNITKQVGPGRYKLEFWAKGRVDVTGGTILPVRVSPANEEGWVLFEHEVGMDAPALLTLSSPSSIIDELRLYPEKAQMTTFTFDPLMGMTSSTDINNFITLYEYDDAGRLKWIRDDKGNILKVFQYEYNSQQLEP